MGSVAIDRLIGDVLRIVDSEENKERLRRWETSLIARQASVMGESYRGVPPDLRPRVPDSESAPIPFTVDFGWSTWVKMVGMDLDAYYSDPESYVETELRKKIFRFENLDDDTYIDPVISELLAFSPAIECSLFGMQAVYDGENTPWVVNDPIVINDSDLDALPETSFYNSGLMPQIHEWYDEIRKLVQGRLHVRFPVWLIRCFGVAVQLRGFENLLMDFSDRPEFVHRLLRHVVEAQKNWERERARFLDTEIDRGYLHNDDVGCPTVAPEHYRRFLLPYDQEMGAFYRRCYWHSCGDTTMLLDSIATIPNLVMFHVGPWTDRWKAAKIMGSGIGLDVCLDPERVLHATQEEMRAELAGLVQIGEKAPIAVRADCLYPAARDQHGALRQMKMWAREARRVLQTERTAA
jgi:hypothetical protein